MSRANIAKLAKSSTVAIHVDFDMFRNEMRFCQNENIVDCFFS